MPDEEMKGKIREAITEEKDIDETYEDEFIDILESKYSRPHFDEKRVSLSRMQIKGYKAITDLDLPIPERATIVHGKNSKGKSSFIEATRFNLLGRNEKQPLVTEPIHEEFKKLETDGYWSKNSVTYKIHREMENDQGYTGQEHPKIVKNPEENEHSPSERHRQGDVEDLIGYTPLHQQGFNRFDIFSLFSIIDGDLRSFYNCDDATDLIDVLFGITLTNVERKVENELEECKLEDDEKEAKRKLQSRRQRANRLSEEITNLRADQDQIEADISEKVDERDQLSRLIENKDDVDRALSKKIDIKDDISDLQSRRDKRQDEFRSIKQEISKLEDEAVTEEIAPALQEMQQLVSLPNRCPVCTTEVDPENHHRFHEEGDCPLCGEDVSDDRYETVSEVDEEGEVLEQEKRQEELEDLEDRKRTVKGDIEFLDQEIQEKKEQLKELEEKEDQSKFSEYKKKKEALESDIGSLKEQSRKLELRIEAKREKLHETALDVWRWTQLDEVRKRKEQRQKALEKFQDVIVRERADARKRLQNNLRQRMESLLNRFDEGTFSNANGVTFPEKSSYKYTVHTTERTELKPGLLEEANAELTLHMLLFHTAVLKELGDEEETVPLKLFLIDSPYGNGPDDENAADITDFLLELPEILDSYQLIVAMADSNLADQDRLENSYDLSKVVEHIEVEEED